MRDQYNKKYFFIMNPGSRSGNSGKKIEIIHSLLKEAELDYDYTITKTLDDAYEFSAEANRKGYGTIVAVGGDGTINRVINGFYNKNSERISPAVFGVIYTGTSPDFCKSYNIPTDPRKAVMALKEGKTRRIGIGRIEFENDVKHFACCANIGLGAQLAKNANGGVRKIFGDGLGTFFALIKTLCTYRPCCITLDGRRFEHVYNISIGKTLYVASGLKIKNDLQDGDSRFYVLTICARPLSHIIKLYGGKDLRLEYGSRICISGIAEVEFDGDEGGRLPCVISAAEDLEMVCY